MVSSHFVFPVISVSTLCIIGRHITSCVSSLWVPPASQGTVLKESKSASPDYPSPACSLCTIGRHITSCVSSLWVPPASQGAVLKESQSASPDSSSHACSNGSRLTPSFEVRILYFLCHSCTPLDQLSRFSLLTSSPGSHPGQHEPTGLARLFALAKLPPNPLGNTAGQRPGQPHQRRPSLQKKTAGNSKPATGRTDRAESETTARRPDTTAGSDSTTTRGYARVQCRLHMRRRHWNR